MNTPIPVAVSSCEDAPAGIWIDGPYHPAMVYMHVVDSTPSSPLYQSTCIACYSSELLLESSLSPTVARKMHVAQHSTVNHTLDFVNPSPPSVVLYNCISPGDLVDQDHYQNHHSSSPGFLMLNFLMLLSS